MKLDINIRYTIMYVLEQTEKDTFNTNVVGVFSTKEKAESHLKTITMFGFDDNEDNYNYCIVEHLLDDPNENYDEGGDVGICIL